MRFLFAALFFMGCIMHPVSAQNHVKWKFYYKKTDTLNCELYLSATIDKGWYIFSQYSDGPGPTTITFSKNREIKLIGPVMENGIIQPSPEPIFDSIMVQRISGNINFIQKVQIKNHMTIPVTGTVRFFACNSKTCMPPQIIPFTIPLN